MTHEQIDDHFTPSFEDEEQFNRFVDRLRPRHLSAPERAERDLACLAAHGELTRQEAEIAEVERRTGYREIEAQKDAAYANVWDAEYEVMESKPTTTAGAVARPYAMWLISLRGMPRHEQEARKTQAPGLLALCPICKGERRHFKSGKMNIRCACELCICAINKSFANNAKKSDFP